MTAVYPGASQYEMWPADSSERFEDGTVNFALMMGVIIGLDYMQSIGLASINQHVCSLTAWLLDRLVSLAHANGEKLPHAHVFASHSLYAVDFAPPRVRKLLASRLQLHCLTA